MLEKTFKIEFNHKPNAASSIKNDGMSKYPFPAGGDDSDNKDYNFSCASLLVKQTFHHGPPQTPCCAVPTCYATRTDWSVVGQQLEVLKLTVKLPVWLLLSDLPPSQKVIPSPEGLTDKECKALNAQVSCCPSCLWV